MCFFKDDLCSSFFRAFLYSEVARIQSRIRRNFKISTSQNYSGVLVLSCWLWNKSLLVRHHLKVFAIHDQLSFYLGMG